MRTEIYLTKTKDKSLSVSEWEKVFESGELDEWSEVLETSILSEEKVKTFISKELQNQRISLIKEIKQEAQQFEHSEFCETKGKQFKKCLICILEKLEKE